MTPMTGMGGLGMTPMQMGVPMAVPMGMGVPMAMPMGLGMPMMGMMGMPAMQMMAPIVASTPIGMSPLMAMQALQQQEVAAAAARQVTAVLGQPQIIQQGAIGSTAIVADPKKEAAAASATSAASSRVGPGGGTSAGSTADPAAPAGGGGEQAAAGQGQGGGAAAEADPDEAPPCHLHSSKKPNAKCKFCQRAISRAEKARSPPKAGRSPPARDGEARSRSMQGDSEDYSRRTFNCSPMLKDQIFSSSYFKSLLTINSLEDLIEEIAKYADTLDVYNAGSTTSPSCFVCQVYRLFTLPHAEDLGEIQTVVDYKESAAVRCAGFLYMRFVVPPQHLWDKMEEYLFDDMVLQYMDNGRQVGTTIGEYVEGLLFRDKYFGTPLPRIPMKVKQHLERELAPLHQYRKRMASNLKALPSGRRLNTDVEVYLDGDWVDGVAKEYIGRASLRRRVRVQLDKGGVVIVHLGKVVLRDTEKADSGAESGSDAGARRKRSRSPRRRSGSPDWSRYKGRPEADLIHELRERAKEEAVCGVGQAYARRPLTVEEELWKREPENRVSMLGDEHGRSGAHRRLPGEHDAREETEAQRRQRMEQEEERRRLQRNIMEKYGCTSQAQSAARAAAAAATAAHSSNRDVDEPDVLRLG